jgi:DNA-binding transcriptional LysR family regulator
VSEFRAENPGAVFQLSQDAIKPLIDALRAGRVDLLVTPRPPDPSLAWKRLGTERLKLAVPPDHRLASRRRVRLVEAADEPFVMLKPAYEFRALSEDLCRQAGFEPRNAFEAEDIASVRALVAAGLGVAVVPPLHTPGPDAPELDLADKHATRPIGIAWEERRYRSPMTELFRKFVLDRGPELARA